MQIFSSLVENTCLLYKTTIIESESSKKPNVKIRLFITVSPKDT